MSIPKTVEQKILSKCTTIMENFLSSKSQKDQEDYLLALFVQMSSLHTGIDFDTFQAFYPIRLHLDTSDLKSTALDLLFAIKQTKIPVPLVVSALLGPEMSWHKQKKTGSYYTDFRLAKFLGEKAIQELETKKPKIVDPACGSGILLVSTIIQLFPKRTKIRDSFIENNVFAADLSPKALRNTFLAISFLTKSKKALKGLKEHLLNRDSLFEQNNVWEEVCTDGFDLVIGNPPWERLKITYYEELKNDDPDIIYGNHQITCKKRIKEVSKKKENLKKYITDLKNKFVHQGKGESDLYKMFTELSFNLTKTNGVTSLIIPGGFIRSQGTTDLRKLLFENSEKSSITLFDNKKNFFNIDSRFKFITLVSKKSNNTKRNIISLEHADEQQNLLKTSQQIPIPVSKLKSIRHDLSVPEVKNKNEWSLFKKLSLNGTLMSDKSSPWTPRFCREIDMTKGKRLFSSNKLKDTLPVIEGRMVHQYSYYAKKYISGTGRSAVWEDNLFDAKQEVIPQYHLRERDIPKESSSRTNSWRIGFCDITGQTNERSILASWIPPNVICGNKVPTIVFDNEDEEIANIWLGIANSFVFDWLARRVITTSVNYFILLGLPFPKLNSENQKICNRISNLVSEISFQNYSCHKEYQFKRAEIEALVIKLYDLNAKDLDIILEDFPLIDKFSKNRNKKNSDSITKDYILFKLNEINGNKTESNFLKQKIQDYDKETQIAFVPSYTSYPMEQHV